MEIIQKQIALEGQAATLNWKEYLANYRNQLVRKESECIYFANR